MTEYSRPELQLGRKDEGKKAELKLGPTYTNIMCGIIGYIGPRPVVPILVDGLRRLEYRGYDSAGIAVVNDGHVDIRRSAGKLANLEQVLATDPVSGAYGLGHTRWATHGRPTEENAHPHRDCTGRLVVVHNGIIENYLQLKARAGAAGPPIRHRDRHRDRRAPGRARDARRRPRGGRAACAARSFEGCSRSSCCRPTTRTRSSPRATARPWSSGSVEGEYFVASDIPAILAHTRDVVFLEDGEMAVVRPSA